ncbi:hypothetical protein ACLOJK_000735 [Asimina triloba]
MRCLRKHDAVALAPKAPHSPRRSIPRSHLSPFLPSTPSPAAASATAKLISSNGVCRQQREQEQELHSLASRPGRFRASK